MSCKCEVINVFQKLRKVPSIEVLSEDPFKKKIVYTQNYEYAVEVHVELRCKRSIEKENTIKLFSFSGVEKLGVNSMPQKKLF
jgi:hypothetical protein